MTAASLVGRKVMELVAEEDRVQIRSRRPDRRAGLRTEYDVRLIDADGKPLHVLMAHVARMRDGAYAGGIVVVTDLTARKQYEAALAHRAQHDALTDLPNRVLLRTRLEQALVARQRKSGSLSVLVLDLDRFKQVNDTLGHQAGDALLQQVSQRWLALLEDGDTLARLGGDEFALVLPGNGDEARASALAERLLRAATAPYVLAGQVVRVGVSIGIARAPRDADNAELLLHQADLAMYWAKRRGTGWALYEPEAERATPSSEPPNVTSLGLLPKAA
jgi:diguanylate cyclase (GGDEF)-like protein